MVLESGAMMALQEAVMIANGPNPEGYIIGRGRYGPEQAPGYIAVPHGTFVYRHPDWEKKMYESLTAKAKELGEKQLQRVRVLEEEHRRLCLQAHASKIR